MKSNAVTALLSVLVFLLLWEVLPRIFDLNDLVMPPLHRVIQRAWQARSALLTHGYWTTGVTLIAIFAAYIAALGTIVLVSLSRLASAALEPFLIAGQAIPKVVLLPLLYLVMKDSVVPGVIVGSLIAFFPVFVNVRFVIATIPREIRDLAKVWGYGPMRILMTISLPYSLPIAANTMKLAWLYALIGVVTAELIRPKVGIGFVLNMAQNNIDGPLFYAAAVTSLVIAIMGWGIAVVFSKYIQGKFRQPQITSASE